MDGWMNEKLTFRAWYGAEFVMQCVRNWGDVCDS